MKANGYKIKPRADLHGADLRGANLRGADLRGALNIPMAARLNLMEVA